MTLRSRGVLDLHRVKNTSDRSLGAFKLKSEQGASQIFLDASEGSTTHFAARKGPTNISDVEISDAGERPTTNFKAYEAPK